MPLTQSNLGSIRKQRGLAVAALARSTGVSRQTVYAIEAGTYIPNTEVALRLASALHVSVEDLFCLTETVSRVETVELLPDIDKPKPGQPVQLCEVHGRLMGVPVSPIDWALPIGDAAVSERPLKRSEERRVGKEC